MSIRDKITAWEPAAEWSDAGDGILTLPVETFHDVAVRLKQEGFDFLRSLTGMDWGEGRFGAVYHIESTATGENVVLRVLIPAPDKCGLPSGGDVWKGALLNEREAYDYFGIQFLNHPDMRRLYLRDDWVGYPLRKDYDPSLNPLRMSNEVAQDSTPHFELMPDGSLIRKRGVIFDEGEYVINVGPQHPATHGVLRFRVSLEGEIIRKLDVHCGYIHRGIEKMCESLTYPQTLALTDRLDYLGASQNRHALCMCIEKGLGLEVSQRVQYIRTIMDELQRIDSHLLFFSCLCMDMGALTAFFYGFRDREKVLDIIGEEPDSVVSHGACHARIECGGRKINIVTLHTWPQAYAYRAADREASKAEHGGDRYRLMEMKYVCGHTILAALESERGYWMMMGDFNSRSPKDNWFYGYDDNDTRLMVHDYILHNTPYIDIIGDRYAGEFHTTTYGKSRIDFVYCTQDLYDDIIDARVVEDDYTRHPVRDEATRFHRPSDHLPILVDFMIR